MPHSSTDTATGMKEIELIVSDDFQLHTNPMHSRTMHSDLDPTMPAPETCSSPQPAHDPKSPIGSCLSFCFFLCSAALILFLYTLIDITLADPQKENLIIQSQWWNSRFWSYGRLQSLFVVGVSCSIAEVTLRCARNKRKTRMFDRVALDICLLLFLAICILQFARPGLYHKKFGVARSPVDRGNCVDPVTLDGFSDSCPTFSSGEFVQATKALEGWGANISQASLDDLLLASASNQIFKLRQLSQLMSTISFDFNDVPGLKDYPNIATLTQAPRCAEKLVESGCEILFTRCRQNDCSAVEDQCAYHVVYERFRKCGIETCEKQSLFLNCQIPNAAVVDYLTHVEKKLSDFAYVFEPKEFDLLVTLIQRCKGHAQEQGDPQKRAEKNARACDWKNASTISSNTIINCNKNITTYGKDQSYLHYLDQTHVLLTTSVVLSILVLSSCHSPMMPSVTVMQLLSASLGLIVSLTLFVGGVNTERAISSNGSQYTTIILNVWSSVYLLVSWLCLNHALFMLFPSDEKNTHGKKHNCILVRSFFSKCCFYIASTDATLPKSTSSLPKRKLSLSKVKSSVKYGTKEFFSSRGKFYMVLLLVKELGESTFQLAGVISTAPELEARFVFGTTLVIALNLVVLPIVNLSMRFFYGPVVATGAVIIVETVFDKALMFISVFLRDTSVTNDTTVPILEQLLRHSITLWPALTFARNKAKFVKLYDSWKLRNIDENQNAMKEEKIVGRIVCLVSPISILLGLMLGIFVTSSYYTQSLECSSLIGPIAGCMSPNLYWTNGFFSRTSCAFKYVSAIDCSHHKLLDGVKELPESQLYQNMTSLVRINMSFNAQFTNAPKTWSLVPNLDSLDLSHTGLQHLPYSVCAMSSLNTLHLNGTDALLRLDWSGEILEINHTRVLLSEGCLSAVKNNLIELVLANNQLECSFTARTFHPEYFVGINYAVYHGDAVDSNTEYMIYEYDVADTSNNDHEDEIIHPCDFSIVSELTQLGSLDLTNNSVSIIHSELMELSANNQLSNTSNKGVNLKGNPVSTVIINSATISEAQRWFEFMETLDLSYVTLFECVAVHVSQFTIPFDRMQSLKVIKAGINEWTSIDGFEGMKHLQYFSTNHVKLDGESQSLKAASFQGQKQLEFLVFEHIHRLNEIEYTAFQELTSLKAVYLECAKLQNCLIQTLSAGTFNVSSLNAITVRDFPKLSYIGDGTFHSNLKSLRLADLNNFRLDTLTNEPFANLVNLKSLHVTRIKVPTGTFQKNVFENLAMLEFLWLRNNDIKQLPIGFFRNMKHLITVSLAYNQFIEIPDNMFEGLATIEQIHLQSNAIQKITNQTFSQLPRLIRIDLSNNNITEIETSAFLYNGTGSSNREILAINLLGNPIWENSTNTSGNNMTSHINDENRRSHVNDENRRIIGGIKWCRNTLLESGWLLPCNLQLVQ